MSKELEGLETHGEEVVSAIGEALHRGPFDERALKKSHWGRLRRAVEKLRFFAAALFVSTGLIGVLVITSTAKFRLGDIIFMSLVAVVALGLLAALLDSVLELGFVVLKLKKPGAFVQAEIGSDHELAAALARHRTSVLKDAADWLERRIKQHERRLIRYFGGPDKLALIAVAGGAWLVWKEAQKQVGHIPTDYMTWVAAFFTGLVIGGMALNKLVDRLCFARDVIQMALGLKTSLEERSKDDEPDDPEGKKESPEAAPAQELRGKVVAGRF